jgi:BirA family biotin operon repressor/biotin-[acetyl-CoA-carboxylase] ligase
MAVAAPFISRREHFEVVGSTNDIVRDWLAADTAEVCLAVADEQSAGRGREGRSWTAPPGAALLLSLGFRPTWLPPDGVWRLAAVVSLAMAEAGEQVARVEPGAIRLKWPNDLVVEDRVDRTIRKIAGVLGETEGLGTNDTRAVVGIGINADWPMDGFPSELADSMTSLAAIGNRWIDNDELLAAFLTGLETRVESLRTGWFDGAAWIDRQVTTGRVVRLIEHGADPIVVRALGADPETGALVVEDASGSVAKRHVYSADVVHVRLEPTV